METFKEVLVTILGFLGAGLVMYIFALLSEWFGLSVKEGFCVVMLIVGVICMFKE